MTTEAGGTATFTLLRHAIENHADHVFKTVGDAFCSSFDNLAHAVSACIDAQREIQSGDWGVAGGIRIRAAVHTGMAEERD